MRQNYRIFLFVWIALLCGVCAPHAGDRISGRVKKVLDGDSLIVTAANGRELEVRMYGIDAPEHLQAGGEQAKAALRDMVDGKQVVLRVIERDQHGRLVAWVDQGNTSVNVKMVQQGWAWWYRHYAPHKRKLRQAEMAARKAARGLWAGKDPIAPWEWRRLPEGKQPLAPAPKHWLNRKSGIRHNPKCQYYRRGAGRPCRADEGRACKECGG